MIIKLEQFTTILRQVIVLMGYRLKVEYRIFCGIAIIPEIVRFIYIKGILFLIRLFVHCWKMDVILSFALMKQLMFCIKF